MGKRWMRLHSYGSVWHMLGDEGVPFCGRSIPHGAVTEDEPRAPNSYICSRCYRISVGMDPRPTFYVSAEGVSPLVSLEERLSRIEALLSVQAKS